MKLNPDYKMQNVLQRCVYKKLTVSRNRIYSSTTGIKPIPINNVKKYRTKRSDRTRFMAATSKHKDADYRHLPTNHGNLKKPF